MSGTFAGRNKTESEPGAVNQTPTIEFNSISTSGTRDLYTLWGIDNFQHGLSSSTFAIAIAIFTNEPATIPISLVFCGGATIGIIFYFLDNNFTATSDGFGASVIKS